MAAKTAQAKLGRAGTGRSDADRKALEGRRKQAIRQFKKGVKQADVARELGVSRQSVSVWFKEWQQGGDQALARAPRAGRPRKLEATQLKAVERALLKGATANGYRTDLWTLKRVAEVIEKTTGVRYHQGHVWKVLKALGWSLQRPAKRAIERDDQKIDTWVRERWPRVKKTPGDGARGSSSSSRASR
jgi:transposase